MLCSQSPSILPDPVQVSSLTGHSDKFPSLVKVHVSTLPPVQIQRRKVCVSSKEVELPNKPNGKGRMELVFRVCFHASELFQTQAKLTSGKPSPPPHRTPCLRRKYWEEEDGKPSPSTRCGQPLHGPEGLAQQELSFSTLHPSPEPPLCFWPLPTYNPRLELGAENAFPSVVRGMRASQQIL